MHSNSDNIGYGASLLAARNAAGLSQQAVADKLRLQIQLVDALEKEDQKALPAPIYVRGYIRSYAGLVGCDAEKLIRQYNQRASEDPTLKHSAPVETRQQSSKTVRLWAGMVIVIALLVVALLWLKGFKPSIDNATTDIVLDAQPDPMSAMESVPDVTLASPIDNGASSDAASMQSEVPSDSLSTQSIELTLDKISEESVVEEAEAAASEAAVGETVNNDSQDKFDISVMPDRQDIMPEAPYGTDSLTLAFSGPCWVEAVDANGYRLLFGLFNAEDNTVSVQGQAPFQLILGNAHWAAISINGKRFELKPFIRSNNTARLLLKADATLYQ